MLGCGRYASSDDSRTSLSAYHFIHSAGRYAAFGAVSSTPPSPPRRLVVGRSQMMLGPFSDTEP
eukprot:scaffold422406_cov35-Attheya_sp.AAC.1